jgi:hypothetical protein
MLYGSTCSERLRSGAHATFCVSATVYAHVCQNELAYTPRPIVRCVVCICISIACCEHIYCCTLYQLSSATGCMRHVHMSVTCYASMQRLQRMLIDDFGGIICLTLFELPSRSTERTGRYMRTCALQHACTPMPTHWCAPHRPSSRLVRRCRYCVDV